MKPNVFLVNPVFDEDELTAYWHYALAVVPGLGQRFVDHVSNRAQLTPSRFIGALDHPIGDRSNHPDLRIQCSDYDLLFEHKLNSPVGPRQLHRYLDLAISKGWKLALIAAHRVDVDDAIRQSSSFVCPHGTGEPSHFLWQEVHGLLTTSADHIAQEFKEYLEFLGLGYFAWAGLGDPFIDERAAEELRSLYDAVKPIFKTPGTSCRKRPNSLIYEVRKPFAPVHLLNFGPYNSVQQWDRRLQKPVMALWLWIRRPGGGNTRVLPTANGYIRDSSPRIFVQDGDNPTPLSYDREVFCERYYYIHLDEILVQSHNLSQDRLCSFVQTAVDHIKGRRELVDSQDSA
jgi:hypothetical protein